MKEIWQTQLAEEAQEFNSRKRVVVEELGPVYEARGKFLSDRPLMGYVEDLMGIGRVLEKMSEEREEMDDENNKLQNFMKKSGLKPEQLNGHRIAVAAEASDVLMFASSGADLLPKMNIDQQKQWVQGVEEALAVGVFYDVNVVNIGVAIVKAKLDYNYPPWAFQLIEGESKEIALERHNRSIEGLKAMRKSTWDGWLSPKVLESRGFSPDMINNPAKAYEFLVKQMTE